MKRRIILMIFVVLIGCTIDDSTLNVYAEEVGENADIISDDELLYETDVITRKDYREGFRNYAYDDATVDWTKDRSVFSNNSFANVVGVVKDFETNESIPNAMISVDGETIVITGEDGRFHINNLPSGTYNWEINVAGYFGACYCNYDVDSADGTTIFTFFISKVSAIMRDRKELREEEQMVTPVSTDGERLENSSILRSMNSIPSVDDSVAVYYNGKVEYVDRETYVYTVLSSELYGTSYYSNKGLTSTQITELYEAQAIAANTFLEYALSVYSSHSASGYRVCSSAACCQKYDPTKVTQAAISATANIFYTYGGVSKTDIVMYRPTSASYEYIWGAFFSSCGGNGTKDHAT